MDHLYSLAQQTPLSVEDSIRLKNRGERMYNVIDFSAPSFKSNTDLVQINMLNGWLQGGLELSEEELAILEKYNSERKIQPCQ